MHYLFLLIAIIAEVIATSFLKVSEGFTRLWPSVVVVVGYGAAFYLLSLVIEKLQVGVVYAIWSGLGIVLVTVVCAFWFKQIPDTASVIGMGLIIAGVRLGGVDVGVNIGDEDDANVLGVRISGL